MNRFSFDVLLEPWIPALYLDGKFEERGIMGCLQDAHRIREIRSPAPIIEFGLYRLLVAFVLDVLITADRRPEDEFDLQDLMQEGRFDMQLIQEYIEECGDVVFDLFNPKRPFLQTNMGNERPKPLAGMFPAVPSGTNVCFWHHKHEEDLAVSCQEAARMLTTIAPFMTAGGRSLSPSINYAPPLYVLPLGKNLFETILLNTPLRKEENDDDRIAWRNDSMPGEARSQATTLEALTWRPRQIQLIPEKKKEEIIIRKIKYKKGDSSKFKWRDASVAYRFEKKDSDPIRMYENRPIWRDAGPLLLLNNSDHGRAEGKVAFRRPDVVDQAFSLQTRDHNLLIQIYGMRTYNKKKDKKNKVFEWIKSSLIVPTGLGRFTRLGAIVNSEVDRAERVSEVLCSCIKALYPREGEGNKNALGSLINRSERAYWQSLESFFYKLMSAFGSLKEESVDDPLLVASTAKEWRTNIRFSALKQLKEASEDMDSDSDALERRVHARTRLQRSLAKLLGEGSYDDERKKS